MTAWLSRRGSGQGSGREGCRRAGPQRSGAGSLGEGADLIAANGFLLEQRIGELGEGLSVLGEQVAGPGFRAGQQVGDFLVDEPLGVLGVAALAEGGVPGGLAGVTDRVSRGLAGGSDQRMIIRRCCARALAERRIESSQPVARRESGPARRRPRRAGRAG
jgi:hypothetical protein